MATEDLSRIIRSPGRFCLTPTDFAIAFPCGGTSLGYVREAYVEPRTVYYPIVAEEWGCTVETIRVGESPRIVAIARGYDPDLIGLGWPGAVAADNDGNRIIKWERPGALITAVKILFVPDDLSIPGVYFRRALPQLGAMARLSKSLDQDTEIAIVFEAGYDSGTNGPYQIGIVSKLTL